MTTKKKPNQPSTPEAWAADSTSAWKQRGAPHRITLPSGQRVLARVLGVGSMARLGGLPRDLSDAVVLDLANRPHGGLPAVIAAEHFNAAEDPKAEERATKHVDDFLRLMKYQVAEALVEPKLTVEELDEVPENDLEFLMEIVTSRRNFDAAGIRIGVEPTDAWAPFSDEHRCPAGCQACIEARRRLSSLLLDDRDM